MSFLYEQVAQTLTDQIARGNLRPGDRCPSVRQVQKQFEVSLSTAVQALALLERRGLVEARPQSGYYIRSVFDPAFILDSHSPRHRVTPCRVETTPLINEVVAAVRDPSSVPLGAVTLGADLLPGAAVFRAMTWAARELGPEGLQYELPPGNEELRRQIARLSLAAGIEVSADEILITTGGMEAIAIALRAVTKPGDTVAIESPFFYGIIELLASLGLKTAEIATHPVHGLDVSCLASVMKARKIAAVLAIPNFNNPLGSKMPDAVKKELVELLAKDCVPLIEDDVYGDLQHDGGRPITCKSFDKKGNVLYCSSFSKAVSPGLRVGWIVPGKHFQAVERLKFVGTIATATLPQAAVAHLLESGAYEKHLKRLRPELGTRMQQYQMAIKKHFPEGTRVSQPEGGFVQWVQLPEGVDALALRERARAKKITFIPGPAFSSELKNYTSCLRISCGAPLNKIVDNALKTLGQEAAACRT